MSSEASLTHLVMSVSLLLHDDHAPSLPRLRHYQDCHRYTNSHSYMALLGCKASCLPFTVPFKLRPQGGLRGPRAPAGEDSTAAGRGSRTRRPEA